MASSVTTTGEQEMRTMIAYFPAAEQVALREVAHQTALREQATAQRLVRVDTGITHDSIVVREDAANHQYLVEVGPTPHPGRHGHWATFVRDLLAELIEKGTQFMAARPFMRPASDQEIDRYRRDMETASAESAQKVFKD